MLTFTELANRVNEIKASAHDPERACGLEDDLYRDFVKFIAKEHRGDLGEMAEIVLSTQNIPFPRDY